MLLEQNELPLSPADERLHLAPITKVQLSGVGQVCEVLRATASQGKLAGSNLANEQEFPHPCAGGMVVV